MSGEIQIGAVVLEHRHEPLAHVVHTPTRIRAVVRVVGTLGVGRVVPIADDEVLGGRGQVFAEPVVHGAARAVAGTDVGLRRWRRVPVRVVRVQRDEVDVAVVVGVVRLGAAGDAAGFTPPWVA